MSTPAGGGSDWPPVLTDLIESEICAIREEYGALRGTYARVIAGRVAARPEVRTRTVSRADWAEIRLLALTEHEEWRRQVYEPLGKCLDSPEFKKHCLNLRGKCRYSFFSWEDLRQETAARAYKTIDRYNPDHPKASIEGWVYILARNINSDRFRRDKAHSQTSLPSELLGLLELTQGSEDEGINLMHSEWSLEDLLKEVREILRNPVSYTIVYGTFVEQLAEAELVAKVQSEHGCSLSGAAIRKRRSRAMKKLNNELPGFLRNLRETRKLPPPDDEEEAEE